MAAPSSAEQFLLSDWNSLSFPEIEECSLIGEQLYKHCQIERSINGRKRKSSEARGAHLREREEKEMSQEDESPKEEYIHVRAKRGHATNSHSLAERVRREKISERMKVLQDLVPGCNKITGKAVMLDEIINYVQSLQKQVEFLSMKLAAVHPELKVDIEQIFSRDIHHQAWENTATILGLGSGLRAQYQHFHGAGQMQSEEVMMHQISSMSQLPNVWDEELQDAMDMVFIHHHKQ